MQEEDKEKDSEIATKTNNVINGIESSNPVVPNQTNPAQQQ